MAVTAQALLVSDRLHKRLPKSDADILYCMVGIDVQVSLGGNLQVYHAVARYLIQHMIKKWNTSCQCRLARSIQIDIEVDPGFQCITVDLGLTHHDSVGIKR